MCASVPFRASLPFFPHIQRRHSSRCPCLLLLQVISRLFFFHYEFQSNLLLILFIIPLRKPDIYVFALGASSLLTLSQNPKRCPKASRHPLSAGTQAKERPHDCAFPRPCLNNPPGPDIFLSACREPYLLIFASLPITLSVFQSPHRLTSTLFTPFPPRYFSQPCSAHVIIRSASRHSAVILPEPCFNIRTGKLSRYITHHLESISYRLQRPLVQSVILLATDQGHVQFLTRTQFLPAEGSE